MTPLPRGLPGRAVLLPVPPATPPALQRAPASPGSNPLPCWLTMTPSPFAPPVLPPRRLALLAAATAAALACAPATAQTTAAPAPAAAASEPARLPVVRASARADATQASETHEAYTSRASAAATRLDLSLRETPQSVSIVTRTQIEDFGLTSANRLLSSVTGVNVEVVETDRSYFSVRGFEVSNFQLDGIGLPFATGDQQGDIDTALYDRVEVLRGANGLLASTGNPSATVNFVRKRPTAQRQAAAALTLGSWNDVRVDADLAGPLNAGGSVRGRLVVALQDKDSYLDRYQLRKTVVGGTLEADLAEATVLSVGLSQQRNQPRSPMWGALPLAYADGTPTHYPTSANSSADWAYWNTSDTQLFAELRHALSAAWELQASLLRRELSSDGEMFYVYDDAGFLPGSGTGLNSWPSKYDHVERQWLADVHVRGSVDVAGRRHDLVLGLNSGRSDNLLQSSDDDVGLPLSEAQVLAGSFPRPAFDAGRTGYAEFENRRTALYGAVRINPADMLKLLLGANLTHATSSGTQYGLDHAYRHNQATPYLGLVLDLDAQHTLYASHARIFNPQHQTDLDGRVLDPIAGSNTELGLKGAWLQQRLNASVALFRVRQDNTPEYAGFADGQSRYRGVDATSTGIELDIAGQPAPGWQVSGGFTQLRIEDAAGADARPYVPRKTLRLSASHRLAALPLLKLGASVKWQSATTTVGATARQDAYALLDLMARYELGAQLSLTAQLHNATDRRHLNSLMWSQSFYGAPRSASVSLAWQH